jgi:hypothetical protein
MAYNQSLLPRNCKTTTDREHGAVTPESVDPCYFTEFEFKRGTDHTDICPFKEITGY